MGAKQTDMFFTQFIIRLGKYKEILKTKLKALKVKILLLVNH